MKLTQKQAAKFVRLAYQEVDKHPSLRFGQALWNLLTEEHKDLTDRYNGTSLDFYYQAKDADVMDCFFNEYVEYSDED